MKRAEKGENVFDTKTDEYLVLVRKYAIRESTATPSHSCTSLSNSKIIIPHEWSYA